MAALDTSSDGSLLPGPDTYTLERIRSQLRVDTYRSGPDHSEGRPWVIDCIGLEYAFEDGTHRFFTKEKQETIRKAFCRRLFDALSGGAEHCSRLNAVFSEFVICNFSYDDFDEAVTKAFQLLRRLPMTPLALPDLPAKLDPIYSRKVSFDDPVTTGSVEWRDIRVVSYVASNVLRAAVIVAISGAKAECTMLKKCINNIADLTSTASSLSATATSDAEKSSWFLVRAFLWTAWQRTSMLYFYSVSSGHLELGYDDHNDDSLILRSLSPAPGMSIQEMSALHASSMKPDYMCGWAFELLRTQPCALGLDFRRFHKRFAIMCGDKSGRCIPNNRAPCRGNDTSSCQRFRGMKIENQSMHNVDCEGGCEKLVWDEMSFRSISGAKAVALIDASPQGKLMYTQASDLTLAISHVWSHGQGGRPEVGYGMNACLHRRYLCLAKSLGCHSYWMDTPCIPEDHGFRREAILNINSIFERSRAVLICDQDLMGINISNLTLAVCETILVTVTVCDWNLRAWTFLEAYRGRRNIHILCQHNTVVSLKEIVEKVHCEGSIDIALFLLTIPHLLPSRTRRGMRTTKGAPSVSAFLTVEKAGSLLSHREASRPGDDVVIWSLLLGDQVFTDAKDFWKSREGSTVSVSFLVSSAPRLKRNGWRWAPASPIAEAVPSKSNGSVSRLLSFDGSDSDVAGIQKDGLHSTFLLMYDFVGGLPGSELISKWFDIDMESKDARCKKNLQTIRQRYLRGYIWGALFRPIDHKGFSDPVIHRSNSNKTFVIVCATNSRIKCPFRRDDRVFWTWRGVHEWDMAEPLPQFVRIFDIWIV